MRLQALYVLHQEAHDMVFGPEEQARIEQLVHVISPPLSRQAAQQRPDLLSRAHLLISGWGGPTLDAEFLDAAPRLQAVFFGAGSVSNLVTPLAWERGIVVTSAYAANAVPVAEYTLSMIIFSLKHGWGLSRIVREQKRFPSRDDAPGCYRRTVGLVSLGMIARTLLNLLKSLDVQVIAYDPFVTAEDMERLGVQPASLPEIFRQADVVSIHTPLLPDTRGMIGGELIASMKKGATLINTSRGSLIKEAEMIFMAEQRNDLQFVLDVTEQEPPEENSRLYALPNVILTPHIAGSVGQECRRMGQYIVDELDRYIHGQPLKWQVTPELAHRSSHAPVTSVVRPARAKPESVTSSSVR
jgi:phosphoglycerate dehydrogenase-like enzyme